MRCTRKAAASTPARSTPPCAARRRQARPRSSSWTVTAPAKDGRSTRLIPEELDPDCEYVVQNEWTEYTEYLESGVDAALFVGMHAMAGTPDGVLAHTVSGSSWWRLRFNGVEVGETGINAALCGAWGCPVLLVTGDEASCREGCSATG